MKITKTRALKLINSAVSFLLVLCFFMSASSMMIYSATDSKDGSDSADAEVQEGVVFAKSDVRKGTKLTAKHVELREVKGSIPANAITSLNDAVGKYALMDLNADEYLYSDQVSKAKGTDEDDPSKAKYINVADFVKPDLGRDVYSQLQSLIDDNPKKTLYFPDGEYLISKSLKTHGDPSLAVSFLLGDGAVIKATDNWTTEKGCDSLVQFGVYESFNKEVSESGPLSDVISTGSYFWIQGGTFDGNGVANGISLDGGRETLIKNTVIKNVNLGIRINIGVNNKSSDMDVDDVIIMCSPTNSSVGIEIWGYDNTFTNTRIYDAKYGVTFPKYDYEGLNGTSASNVCSGGNAFRDIRIVRTEKAVGQTYNETIGFDEGNHGNMYYHCYVENYARAYKLVGNIDVVDSCKAKWTSRPETSSGTQIAVSIHGSFHTNISCFRAEFAGGWLVHEGSNHGGVFESLITNDQRGLPSSRRNAVVPTK